MLPSKTREHVITALGATPLVLARLVECYPSEGPQWDRQEPGRFTPREHVAHMADWEEVFHERIRLTAEMDQPPVPNPDETALSIERQYSLSDPIGKAQLFAVRRQALIDFLKERQEDDWQRVGIHPKNGP